MRVCKFLLALAVIGALGLAGQAQATPLAPGGVVAPGTIANPLTAAGNTVVGHTSGTATGTLNGATLNVQYNVWVVRVGAGNLSVTNTGSQQVGNLDFVYQFTNLSSSSTVVESTSVFNFGITGIGVDYVSGSGAVAPNLSSRSSNGQAVKFNFLGAGDVNAGQSSTMNVIETTYNYFTTGNLTFQDGVTINVNAFQPVATPEPSSIVLVGLAFLGLAGGYGWKRRPAWLA